MEEHTSDQTTDVLEKRSRFDPALLAALLGRRLRLIALDVKGKHQRVPVTAANNLNFYSRRCRALAPRNMRQSQDPAAEDVCEPADLARFPSAVINGDLRQQLSRRLETTLPSVRIHHHHYARQVVQQLHADAVTIGQDVLVPSPQALQGPRGMALLGHELTHAAQERQRPRSRTATVAEERIREITAMTRERMLLGTDPTALPSAPPAGPPTPIRRARTNTGLPIRAASQGRDLGVPTAPAASAPSAGLDASQMRQIQDAVYRDLMLRVREEFERGN